MTGRNYDDWKATNPRDSDPPSDEGAPVTSPTMRRTYGEPRVDVAHAERKPFRFGVLDNSPHAFLEVDEPTRSIAFDVGELEVLRIAIGDVIDELRKRGPA